jgi:hypothetical protein
LTVLECGTILALDVVAYKSERTEKLEADA